VQHQEKIIGTVALVYVDKGVYELAKMAVDEQFQGLGAGKLLCKTAIEEAKNLGAEKLILVTNSKLKTAISIYHKSGFKEVAIGGSAYSRADTKMELLLAQDIKWFDRKFDFNLSDEDFPILLERLQTSIDRFEEVIRILSECDLTYKPQNKWSIKEHLGHLGVLEPLWQIRFQEIKNNQGSMTPADLNNTATNEAAFNTQNREVILKNFNRKRGQTVKLLKSFSGADFLNHISHPRLNQQMRIIDLMYFVAEHDDHHLRAITKIIANRKQQ
jgi:uncharacterized damage-inducible protein DinB/predicted GNAT family acetyltransferase